MKNNFKFSIPLAILITLAAVIYQRSTGPTYPKKVKLEAANGTKVRVKFLRSHVVDSDARLEIPKVFPEISAKVTFRRYPTNEEWTELDFVEEKNQIVAALPKQPAAGKLEYFVQIFKADQMVANVGELKEPVIIRFKGDVPTYILAPHIFCMFMALLFGALAGMEALFKTEMFYKLSLTTLGFLSVGGLVLGPLVQKFAFGVYWAGFPYDWDLTDNKLLVSVIAWVFAALMSFGKKRTWASVIAMIVMMGMYCIPHSMQGSQYNYEKGSLEYK